MKNKPHGRTATYNLGCRCEACMKANTVRKWVQFNVMNWNEPLLSKGAKSFSKNIPQWKGCVEIDQELIHEVFKRNEDRLKREILSLARSRKQV